MQDISSSSKSIIKGVALLSGVALLAKILSAAYRIPYQNLAGDLGYYVYQQVYPLYGIVVVLAMYGFPVVLSKQRAELLAQGQIDMARNMLSLFFYGLLFFAVLIWGILYLSADVIATMMGDPLLSTPIQAMSYVVLLLPFLSIGRGFHQGEGDLVPTAFSHVFEQLIRVFIILVLTYWFVIKGYDAYSVGAGAAYGSVLGGVTGVLTLVVLTRARWLKHLVSPFQLNRKKMFRSHVEIIKQSVFICLSALIFVSFQLIDAFSVVRLMLLNGVEEFVAFEAKGVFDRSQPLLQLGTILTTTFTLALVPMLSKAVIEGNMKLAKQYQSLSYRLTLLIGGGATVGLFIIIEPTNHMLFTDTTGSNVIRVMSLAILFSSFFVTGAAVSQGYNYAHLPAVAVFLGLLVKVVANLLFIPKLGTMGAAWSTVISTAFMVIFLLYALKRKRKLYVGLSQTYLPILTVLFGMGVVTWIWQRGLAIFISEVSRGIDTFIALSSVAIGGGFLAICLLVYPVFHEEEWNQIPKLNKIRKKIKEGLKKW
ncbi:putative polysaccharide biosynthesis protein [Halalkalibacter akibai]|uniref:Uncharacterized protein n=1 Tax=Halalkalibacter akibai (strain ATCC 43226 / DSM 21942 / CIP 109018 / JCM 9157 / 1139) TaxID=1236973 RepID=W4QY49_HALA3|nr:polysaccharide biosynthesis protein [Halalkalibacter akibai]GAE36573.1 hypothetical protein JCM9157_3770 [Halalkalibacter akibai JCM 9157]